MKNVNAKTFWLCVLAGIVIRFVLMCLGHNFDFESYCIIGELAASGKMFMLSLHAITMGLSGL